MKQIVVAALAMSAVVISTPARADFKSGNDLLRVCESSNLGQYGECIGYIEGVIDVMQTMRHETHKPECITGGIEAGQIRDVVVKYLHDYAEERDQSAWLLVITATSDAWGCR